MNELIALLILIALVLVVVAIVRAVVIGVRALLKVGSATADHAPAAPDVLFAPAPGQPVLNAGWMEPPIATAPPKSGGKRAKGVAPDAIIGGEGIRYGSVCFLTGMTMLTCDCPECAQWRNTHAHHHA